MTAIRLPKRSESVSIPDRSMPRSAVAVAVLAALAGSVVCIAIAPTLMPSSYSLIKHSISESAAQGVEGAWLARAGLLLFGFAVLVSVGLAGSRWGVWGRAVHRSYGVSLVGAATFAHMPWEEVPFDEFEDLLHSVASFGVGIAFIAGVLIVTFRRGRGARLARLFDWVAVVIATVIPLVMFNVTGIAGVVQRIMFAVAYTWYGAEALRSTRTADDEVTFARVSLEPLDAPAVS